MSRTLRRVGLWGLSSSADFCSCRLCTISTSGRCLPKPLTFPHVLARRHCAGPRVLGQSAVQAAGGDAQHTQRLARPESVVLAHRRSAGHVRQAVTAGTNARADRQGESDECVRVNTESTPCWPTHPKLGSHEPRASALLSNCSTARMSVMMAYRKATVLSLAFDTQAPRSCLPPWHHGIVRDAKLTRMSAPFHVAVVSLFESQSSPQRGCTALPPLALLLQRPHQGPPLHVS